MLEWLLGKLSGLPDETYRAVSKEFLESQMPVGRQIFCLVCDHLPASKISLLSHEKLNSLDWRIERLEVKTIKQLKDEQKKEAEDRAEQSRKRTEAMNQLLKQQGWTKGSFIPFESIIDVLGVKKREVLDGKDPYGRKYDRMWSLIDDREDRFKRYKGLSNAASQAMMKAALETGSDEVFVKLSGRSLSRTYPKEFERLVTTGSFLHVSRDFETSSLQLLEPVI